MTMVYQTALELLDCVRPDSDDLELPELADARQHLDSCEQCRLTFAERQEFDSAVSVVLHDIAVPTDLATSLQKAIDRDSKDEANSSRPATESQTSETEQQRDSQRRSRKRLAWQSTVLVALIGVAIGVLTRTEPPQRFDLHDIALRVNLDAASLETFNGSETLDIPAYFDGGTRIGIERKMKGQNLDEQPGHDVAVTRFVFRPARAAPFTGVIVAVPISRLNSVPTAADFSVAQVFYVRNGASTSTIAMATWKERETVYLCFVSGNASHIEQMQNYLGGQPA